MSEVQIDGASAVTKTSTDNNGGTIKNGGTLLNSALWSNSTLGHDGQMAVMSATVVSGVGGVSGVNSSIDFGINLAEGLTRRVSTTIADQSNTSLVGGSKLGVRRSIPKMENIRTNNYASGIRNGDWNVFTGAWTTDLIDAQDAFGEDHAARPSRSTPGELVYQHGSNTPKQDDYKAKTGG